MTIHPKTTLEALPKGALFITPDGIAAVKSEYRYPDGAPLCVLLESGEYAHFPDGGATVVHKLGLGLAFVRRVIRGEITC